GTVARPRCHGADAAVRTNDTRTAHPRITICVWSTHTTKHGGEEPRDTVRRAHSVNHYAPHALPLPLPGGYPARRAQRRAARNVCPARPHAPTGEGVSQMLPPRMAE